MTEEEILSLIAVGFKCGYRSSEALHCSLNKAILDQDLEVEAAEHAQSLFYDFMNRNDSKLIELTNPIPRVKLITK